MPLSPANPHADRALVLGGEGMLGHQLVRQLAPAFSVTCTVRGAESRLPLVIGDSRIEMVHNVDAHDFDGVARIIRDKRPAWVLNAIGLVKQRKQSAEWQDAIAINALLPRRLAYVARACGAKLIHFSTDCVFAGTRGSYSEDDVPDARDIYGISKLLGEVREPGCLTVRTSIVGPELGRVQGLFEWFKSQSDTIKGFTNAYFSGVTTTELARIVVDYIIKRGDLEVLFNISGPRISKFELLQVFRDVMKKNIEILPDGELKIDRSLDGSRFRLMAGYKQKDWKIMVQEMLENE